MAAVWDHLTDVRQDGALQDYPQITSITPTDPLTTALGIRDPRFQVDLHDPGSIPNQSDRLYIHPDTIYPNNPHGRSLRQINAPTAITNYREEIHTAEAPGTTYRDHLQVHPDPNIHNPSTEFYNPTFDTGRFGEATAINATNEEALMGHEENLAASEQHLIVLRDGNYEPADRDAAIADTERQIKSTREEIKSVNALIKENESTKEKAINAYIEKRKLGQHVPINGNTLSPAEPSIRSITVRDPHATAAQKDNAEHKWPYHRMFEPNRNLAMHKANAITSLDNGAYESIQNADRNGELVRIRRQYDEAQKDAMNPEYKDTPQYKKYGREYSASKQLRDVLDFPALAPRTKEEADANAAPPWKIPDAVQEQVKPMDIGDLMGKIKLMCRLPQSAEKWGRDIFGMDELKRALEVNVIGPQRFPELYNDLQRPRRNILMWGPPGTGKTMIAMRVAALSNAIFVNVPSAEIVSGFMGDGALLITMLYKTLQLANKPAVVFMDEAEQVIGTRGSGGNSSENLDSIKQAIMVNIEENQIRAPIYTLFATNIPQSIDPAINSRIGTSLPVWIPSTSERTQRLRYEFGRAVKLDIADPAILKAKFIAECVGLSTYRSHRTITSALRKAWNTPTSNLIHQIAAQGLASVGTHDIRSLREKVSQDDIREAIRLSESSEESCKQLSNWAVANSVELNKYIPDEYHVDEHRGVPEA